jgi:uncharacterized protein YkwD
VSIPPRSRPFLAAIALALAVVVPNAGAATHSRARTHAHKAKHHTAHAVRVCWTSKRKHRRICHLRVRGPHRTRSHPHSRGQVRAAHRDQTPREQTPRTIAVKVSTPTPGSSAGSSAASIASVLATPCQGTELTPQPDNLEAIRAATGCLVNQERARNGEPPLGLNNDELEQAAQGHSDEMVAANYFDHVSPSGETPLQRLQAAGYIPAPPAGYAVGENIAWGTLSLATPSAIVTAWIASPEHLANILNASYRDSAIGVAPAAPASLAQGQAGAVYTEEFGVILR